MAKVNSSLEAKTRVNLDPEALRWSPMIPGSGSLYGSPFKKSREMELEHSSPEKSKKKRKKKKHLKSNDDESEDESTSSSSDSDEDSDNTKKIVDNKKGRKTGQRNNHSVENHKTSSTHSGESKGLAGGIININTNIKKKNASVVSTLNFEDSKTEEAKNNLVPTPKRGHNTSGLKNKTVYKSTILGQAIGKFKK